MVEPRAHRVAAGRRIRCGERLSRVGVDGSGGSLQLVGWGPPFDRLRERLRQGNASDKGTPSTGSAYGRRQLREHLRSGNVFDQGTSSTGSAYGPSMAQGTPSRREGLRPAQPTAVDSSGNTFDKRTPPTGSGNASGRASTGARHVLQGRVSARTSTGPAGASGNVPAVHLGRPRSGLRGRHLGRIGAGPRGCLG
jgi:hypothetical protein